MNVFEQGIPAGGAKPGRQIQNLPACQKPGELVQDVIPKMSECGLGRSGTRPHHHVRILKRFEEFRNRFRRMLPVGIHENDDGRAGGADAGFNGRTVADITVMRDDRSTRQTRRVGSRVG